MIPAVTAAQLSTFDQLSGTGIDATIFPEAVMGGVLENEPVPNAQISR